MSDANSLNEPVDGSPLPDLRVMVAGRLSLGYLLDLTESGHPGEALIDLLIIAAVANANIANLLHDPDLHARYARLETPPPEEMRRPISVNALAASLNQPFETVRRRVNGLVARGICVVTPSGIYVPMAAVTTPHYQSTARRGYKRLWRFHDEAVRAGVIEPAGFAPPPVDAPEAPVYGVARIITDYWLRSLDDLCRLMRDPITAVVYLGVLRANCGPNPTSVVERARPDGSALGHDRPARMADLSRRQGIAYETVRRRAHWLVEHGYCLRKDDGLVYAPKTLFAPEFINRRANNLTNLKRMFRHAIALVRATRSPDSPGGR